MVMGRIGVGIVAALMFYLVCALATFLLGGWVYSVAWGTVVAPLLTAAILVYLWFRQRDTAPWTVMVTMLTTQVVLAAVAVSGGPGTAQTMFGPT